MQKNITENIKDHENIGKIIVVNRENQDLESDESESQYPANAPFQEHLICPKLMQAERNTS